MLLVTALISAAFATETVPVAFDAPKEVRMFSDARILTGTGTAKGAACDEAVALALAEIEADAEKKKYADVVAVFPDDEIKQWQVATEVSCEQKGDAGAPKSSTVKLKALALRPGTDPAYATVSAERATDIVGSLIEPGSMVALQVGALSVDAKGGALYLDVAAESETTYVDGYHKRNKRIVETLRAVALPKVGTYASRVEGTPEIAGIHIAAAYKLQGAEKTSTEIVHLYVPTAAALQFAAGELTEQELVDAGSVMFEGSGAPVKAEVSFADIDNEAD